MKVSELDAALRSLLRPGMAVHLTTQARAATRAIQRVFRGQDLRLTLIMGRIGGGHAADLLASGLVKHVIAGSYGAVSRQYTGRLPQVQQVYAAGKVTFQHWTFFSLTQRLMAAAQGMQFVPTHSLAGSTMAAANHDAFIRIPDPFGSGQSVNLVKALHPDVAILHAVAADEDGNAILLPPLEEGAWGAKASKGGVLVTAEHIVSRATIRKHSHLVKLPGRYVTAVAHVPYGAHPGAFSSTILPDMRSYEEDEAFNAAYFAATRDAAALERWVAEWIHGPASHAAYLEKLGGPRLEQLGLRGAACTVENGGVETAATSSAAPCTDNERLMTLALRYILRRRAERSYDVFLVGAGLSEVPATAAHVLLEEQGIHVDLTMGHGYFGFQPLPGRPNPDASTATMTTDSPDIYATILGGRRGAALAILGAGQVDRRGNLNSTLIEGNILTGSGGSNDCAATCDTLVVTRMSRKKLVLQVEYVTCPGDSVHGVVTECGIFEKSAGGDLVVTSYMDPDSQGKDAVVDRITRNCGWPAQVANGAHLEVEPSARELALIRSLMPSRYE